MTSVEKIHKTKPPGKGSEATRHRRHNEEPSYYSGSSLPTQHALEIEPDRRGSLAWHSKSKLS